MPRASPVRFIPNGSGPLNSVYISLGYRQAAIQVSYSLC